MEAAVVDDYIKLYLEGKKDRKVYFICQVTFV